MQFIVNYQFYYILSLRWIDNNWMYNKKKKSVNKFFGCLVSLSGMVEIPLLQAKQISIVA